MLTTNGFHMIAIVVMLGNRAAQQAMLYNAHSKQKDVHPLCVADAALVVKRWQDLKTYTKS